MNHKGAKTITLIFAISLLAFALLALVLGQPIGAFILAVFASAIARLALVLDQKG